MCIQNSYSPLARAQRPLRTVLIGTSLGSESEQVVVSPEAALAEGIAEAITAQTEPSWHGEATER